MLIPLCATIAIAAVSFILLLLAPIRLCAALVQHGSEARLTLRIDLLFELIRLPFVFILKFDPDLMRSPSDLKAAFSIVRLTKQGIEKPLKRKGKRKAKGERLPISPILSAFSLKKLVLRGQIALEDAASCVLLCGAVNALFEPLLIAAAALLPPDARNAELKAEFLPKFAETSIKFRIEGIVETDPAKLISGLISAFAEKRAKKCKLGMRKAHSLSNTA